MVIKKKVSKGVSKTKVKVTQALNQAKASLKLLEAFEKETVAKAKTFVKIPIPGNPKTLTNDAILAGLKMIGVCTQQENDSLRIRIEKLEAELASLRGKSESPNASDVPQS
jgi:hypothetical protein